MMQRMFLPNQSSDTNILVSSYRCSNVSQHISTSILDENEWICLQSSDIWAGNTAHRTLSFRLAAKAEWACSEWSASDAMLTSRSRLCATTA